MQKLRFDPPIDHARCYLQQPRRLLRCHHFHACAASLTPQVKRRRERGHNDNSLRFDSNFCPSFRRHKNHFTNEGKVKEPGGNWLPSNLLPKEKGNDCAIGFCAAVTAEIRFRPAPFRFDLWQSHASESYPLFPSAMTERDTI